MRGEYGRRTLPKVCFSDVGWIKAVSREPEARYEFWIGAPGPGFYIHKKISDRNGHPGFSITKFF
jgi:hypothetical protein